MSCLEVAETGCLKLDLFITHTEVIEMVKKKKIGKALRVDNIIPVL